MATPAAGDTASQHSNDDNTTFDKVLAVLQLRNLPAVALEVRNRDAAPADTTSAIHDCRIVGDPISGSSNIFFKLEFNDGVRWDLKTPDDGYPDAFDAAAARSLRSEALAMRMIKRETTVPIPEMYRFDDTLDNELRCPFILMEYIDGRPLYEVWYDQNVDPEVLEQRRCRALDDVARAMLQLNKYSFSRGGDLLFDASGKSCDICPTIMMDVLTILNGTREDENFDDFNAYFTTGPFTDAKS